MKWEVLEEVQEHIFFLLGPLLLLAFGLALEAEQIVLDEGGLLHAEDVGDELEVVGFLNKLCVTNSWISLLMEKA